MANKKKIEKISSKENLKYITRLFYYGKLLDWEFVNESMVLKFCVYTGTQYYGNSNNIRIYVPTDLENDLFDNLITGDNYFVIAAPYRTKFANKYPYRVDMLLNIFKEI